MKIVQLYLPEAGNEMMEQYVSTLDKQMKRWTDFSTVGTATELRERLDGADILHCHGCWNATTARALLAAQKRGIRTVLSPHSQLEPWIIRKNYAQHKLPQILLWQRKAVKQAYAVVSAGKLETSGLREIGWNKRIEVVRNSIVTSTTTDERMAQEILLIYRKILDSDPLARMSDDGRRLTQTLLKAGIAGDARWITDDVPQADEETWRQILIFAHHENLDDIVMRGIDLLNIESPKVDAKHISCYLPERYSQPLALSKAINYEATEEAYLLSAVRWMHKEGITLRPLVDLARELRRQEYDEAVLTEKLEDRHLSAFFARLLQLMSEWTGLEEGFMPTTPIDDSRTESMRQTLENHLRI